jgi:hypothetical protein
MKGKCFRSKKGDRAMLLIWNRKDNTCGPVDVPRFLSKKIGGDWGRLPNVGGHWVRYKMVIRPQAGKVDTFDFRIFDEGYTEAKGVRVLSYASLDAYPEMVFLDGWFNKKSKEADVKLTRAA